MAARSIASSSKSAMPLLAICACALALLPLFQPPLFFESFLYLIFFWVTLATSWTILGGFSGYVSFGHGAFYGIGVYAMANLGKHLTFGPTLLLAGLLAAATGVGIGAITFRIRRLRGELFAERCSWVRLAESSSPSAMMKTWPKPWACQPSHTN